MPQISQQMRQEAQPKSNPIGDILSMLLQTAQQQKSQMATAQGDISANQKRMGGGGGQPQNPQTNQNQDPIQMLTSLLSMSNQQQPMQSAYTKGVDKALKESGYAHTTEALTQGVDPMHISNEANRMGMRLGQQSNQDMAPLLQNLLSMAQQPQQPAQQQYTPIQQQAMEQVSTPKSGIGKIFDALGFAEPVRQQKLNTLSKAQEIMGEQPVQEKDRYAKIMDFETTKINKMMDANKVDMTHAQTYLDTIEKQPTFSGEELTKFTALDEMSKAGSKLLARMSKDPTALRTLGLPGDPYGQETLTWANQIAANRKFFQGGSALTPQENKTIESILAKRGLPAQLQDPQVAKKIIDGIMDKAKTVFQKMDPYSEDREYITSARGKGYSDMDILKALRLYRTQRGQ
jgi:hypothetical protein